MGEKGFVVYLDLELLHQVKTVALAEQKTLQEIGCGEAGAVGGCKLAKGLASAHTLENAAVKILARQLA